MANKETWPGCFTVEGEFDGWFDKLDYVQALMAEYAVMGQWRSKRADLLGVSFGKRKFVFLVANARKNFRTELYIRLTVKRALREIFRTTNLDGTITITRILPAPDTTIREFRTHAYAPSENINVR